MNKIIPEKICWVGMSKIPVCRNGHDPVKMILVKSRMTYDCPECDTWITARVVNNITKDWDLLSLPPSVIRQLPPGKQVDIIEAERIHKAVTM